MKARTTRGAVERRRLSDRLEIGLLTLRAVEAYAVRSKSLRTSGGYLTAVTVGNLYSVLSGFSRKLSDFFTPRSPLRRPFTI
jgi:hypothetical protein